MGGHIRNTFFPMVDFDSFTLNVAFTPGDGEKQTLEYLDRFEKAIWEVSDEITENWVLRFHLLNVPASAWDRPLTDRSVEPMREA